MKNDSIKESYLKKINLIKKYNKSYYDESNPIVTDQEYDFIKREIISLENEYKFLKNKHSPTNLIGFKPSKNFKK